MNRIVLFFYYMMLVGTAFGQFPTWPLERIELGLQTANNKYLLVPVDGVPTWTPIDRNDAHFALDTLGATLYYYRTDSSAWQPFTAGGIGDITEVTVGTGLDGGATSGAANISLDFSELPNVNNTLSAIDADQDFFVMRTNFDELGGTTGSGFCGTYGFWEY